MTMTTTTIRVFQGTAQPSDDGWANDAYYALDRAGYEPCEGVDNCTSWEECSGLEDGDEYVTMRVRDAKAAVERLQALGYRAMPETISAPPSGISVVVSANNGWSQTVICDEAGAQDFCRRWGRDNLAADLGGAEYDSWLEALAALAARLAPEVPTLP